MANWAMPEGVHEPTDRRAKGSVVEAAACCGMSERTALRWRKAGLLEGACGKRNGREVWYPQRIWKAFLEEAERREEERRRVEREGMASKWATRAMAEAPVAGSGEVAGLSQEELELVLRRPYLEALKIREDAEEKKYGALSARRKYELAIGELVEVASVREALRGFMSEVVRAMKAIEDAGWVDEDRRAEARSDVRRHLEHLKKASAALKLRQPEME